MNILSKLFGNYSEKEIKRIKPLEERVLALEEEYRALSDEELKNKTYEFKNRLGAGETLDDLLPEAFAACREASDRVLGMRHFPVQIIGGIVLHQGRISEMKTGEGKTLVATLPAYLNALSGKGVHIVTVNDYLAKRDSEWMGKLYRFMGLEVGLIVHGMTSEEKKAAYDADITYCTNNELGFDYLRDNMVIYKERRVQRGHNFAIVDEVDSILIDEARTPLIISGQGEKSTDLYIQANRFAKGLKCIKVKETNDKQSDEEQDFNGDYVVDEKAKTCVLTPAGVKKAEEFFGIDNLNDADNITVSHHIQQAIRAYGIMKRDVDYVVKDGEVIIVDEFTGRLMFGRRYNEGLHQAIEAKEGVKVAHESKTLATITFQNFFRLYTKLSGMTGTAMTEEAEFREIYKLDVIEIPTNKPVIRNDEADVVYKTERAKFSAVIEAIDECHKKGQPVLVGTITIEKSELLSAMLKRRGIPHNVLNAKHHEKEAEIIAQAGKFGAVTIATNMAGRGTDIMLGGNAEYLAKAELKHQGYSDEVIVEATGFGDTDVAEILKAREEFARLNAKFKDEIAPEAQKVKEAGGLFIIGTERHESRRIDNQLRGRAGRQGDPGTTRFYVSLEDDLMRLFGGERMTAVMNSLKVDEDLPLQNAMLSKTIESAQQKIEGRNFAIRKTVLEYDDVMNHQREKIYSNRNQVLDGEDIHDKIINMINGYLESEVQNYCNSELAEEWNIQGLRELFAGWLISENDLVYTSEDLNNIEVEDVVNLLQSRAQELYALREEEYTPEVMRELERVMLLKSVDTNWMEHIDAMDQLKQGINLRAYGQHNPVIAYRNEGFEMFEAMNEAIREQTARLVLTVKIRKNEEVKREKVANETSVGENRTVRGKGIVSKNALCPCGSGKKYKRCCGKDED
ncbi:MAG: preprotein translocase subunit SecA [Ruminococcaceae bacterium]|nr:preprotein translocase subunit SecA [Oscillospiraceae bacterium]